MLKDATTFRQKFPYAMLLAVLLAVGFWPRTLTDVIQKSVASIVERQQTGGVAAIPAAGGALGTGVTTRELAKVQRP
jgi:NADH:ubiquinone oxidoreductase subunit 4 (subunit M)